MNEFLWETRDKLKLILKSNEIEFLELVVTDFERWLDHYFSFYISFETKEGFSKVYDILKELDIKSDFAFDNGKKGVKYIEINDFNEFYKLAYLSNMDLASAKLWLALMD